MARSFLDKAMAPSTQAQFSDPLPLGKPGIPVFLSSQDDREVKASLVGSFPHISFHTLSDVVEGWPAVRQQDLSSQPGVKPHYQQRGAIAWEICRNAQWVLGSTGSGPRACVRACVRAGRPPQQPARTSPHVISARHTWPHCYLNAPWSGFDTALWFTSTPRRSGCSGKVCAHSPMVYLATGQNGGMGTGKDINPRVEQIEQVCEDFVYTAEAALDTMSADWTVGSIWGQPSGAQEAPYECAAFS